jgi:type IV pilus assembly protein PilQ
LFLTAALVTARSQSAPPPAEATPAAPVTTTTTTTETTTIKDGDAHPTVSAKTKDASGKDTLSVDFPDTDIREIVRNVADLFELNLVMPDTLQGKASIKLRDVTWRQIFDVVLKQVGYTFIEKDNIVKIVSLNDLEHEPFATRTFTFENVSSSRIMPMIVPMLTPKREAVTTNTPEGTKVTPAQAGGTIVNNELSNELIVTDQSTVLARIAEMIRRLDTEPRQVVIETKFVEISKDDTKNREVALGYRNTKTGLTVGTGLSSGTSLFSFPFTMGSGSLTGGSPTAVFNQNEFSALLNVLNAQTNVRLVTNPTIVAINGNKSEIKIGRELQLVTITTTTSGSSPVSTATAGDIKFVGISIEVTPQITGSKLISLKVKPVKSSVFQIKKYQENEFYDIDKREGDLNIILRDGQTAAIGGLVDTTTRRDRRKVPLLGDVPLLGSLFRTTADVVTETNLVIFITASVLEPSKLKYENIVSRDQLNSLELTPREVLGKAYPHSAEETNLQDEVTAARMRRAEAESVKNLNKQIRDQNPETRRDN